MGGEHESLVNDKDLESLKGIVEIIRSWTSKIFVIIICYPFHILYHCNIVHIYSQKMMNKNQDFDNFFSTIFFMVLELN